MGRGQGDPNAKPAAAPPQPAEVRQPYPPEVPQQYPPENAPYAAAQKSASPFFPQTPTQPPYQQPHAVPCAPTAPEAPFQPTPFPPPQAPFQPTPFPPAKAPPEATPFPQPQPAAFPPPPQPHQSPANYQPTSNQPFNQTPVPGVPYHKPCVQTPVAQYPAVGTAPWTTGLFDFLDDPSNALITIFLPCVTFGQIAEILDNGHTSCAVSGMMYGLITSCLGIPCILSCTYRTKLRSKYGLMESPAPDFLTHFLCEYCALCQEYRELKNRGIDPAIGWHGNMMVQAQQQQVAMTPPMGQAMRA